MPLNSKASKQCPHPLNTPLQTTKAKFGIAEVNSAETIQIKILVQVKTAKKGRHYYMQKRKMASGI